MTESGDYIIKARGLPWSATPKDVLEFFEDCQIVGGEEGVHLTLDRGGRASGDCFVELASQEELEKAKAHNRQNMGSRYIEIQDALRSEMEQNMNPLSKQGVGGGGGGVDGFVKLRGLPFEATKQDIANFFDGIVIAPYGITLTVDQNGRPSGEGYVEFTSAAEVEKALKKNKEKIGRRYIEIFKTSKNDVKYVADGLSNFGAPRMGGSTQRNVHGRRSGPYDRPSQSGVISLGPSGFNTQGMATVKPSRNVSSVQSNAGSKTGHMVHMRGLPFEASENDVCTFFAPINPVEVRFLFEDSGRAKGECDVDFQNHDDASRAMTKDKQNMGHRYIELFLRSQKSMQNDTWMNNSNSLMDQPVNRNPSFMNQNRPSSGFGDNYPAGGSYGGSSTYGGGGSGGGGGGGGGGGSGYGNIGGASGNGYNSYGQNNGYGFDGRNPGSGSFSRSNDFSCMSAPRSNYY